MTTAATTERAGRYRMLNDVLELGSTLFELEDARVDAGDPAGLRRSLERDGYLLIRGLHPRVEVAAARLEILERLAAAGCLDPGHPVETGRIGEGNQPYFFSQEEIAELGAYVDLVTSERLLRLLEPLLESPPHAFNHRWLRCLPRGGSCGIHYDVVYMSRGTDRILTCWTPLEDLPLEKGPLVLCLGSERFERLRRTYGSTDADRDESSGVLDGGPLEVVREHGGRWATTSFRAGDVLIFGMYMLHGALVNETRTYRITSDTRYQPEAEPIDPRLA